MSTIAVHEISNPCTPSFANVAAFRRAAVASVPCTRTAAVKATVMATAMKRTDKRTTASAVRIARTRVEPPGS